MESWDNCENALLQCFETALPAEFDTALRFGKWMRLRLVPIQKIGIVTHVMLFATDITQQKQSELEVRLALQKAEQSEIRLVEAQKATKVGSWETNLNTLEVIWSVETYHIFEVNENNFQASHQSFLAFVHVDDKVLVDNAFSLSYSHQNYNTLEHRIVASNGKIKYVEERWKIVFDAKG